MAEYIEREELSEFLKDEIQECERELLESNGEDDRYEQAVESRMLGLVEAWRKVTNTHAADVVEVRHGEWNDAPMIKVGGLMKAYPSVKCTNCETVFCDIINNHRFAYHYCPYCGATMDGKGEGE